MHWLDGFWVWGFRCVGLVWRRVLCRKAEMRQEPPNERLVMSRADRLHQLRGKMHKLRLKTLLRVGRLLTPAQRAQLRSLHQARKKRLRKACQRFSLNADIRPSSVTSMSMSCKPPMARCWSCWVAITERYEFRRTTWVA